jgi:hypothetical protein
MEMRSTDKSKVDYEKYRKDYLKNFEHFYDNLDVDLKDENSVKAEVREFMKVSKEYKKQLKKGDGVVGQKKKDSLTELLEYDEGKGCKTSPSRKNKKKDPEAELW